MATTTYTWTNAVDSFFVNTITAGVQASPAITSFTNGNYFSVWDLPLNVEGRILAAGGTSVTGEFQVNSTTANNQFDASIAALVNGNAAVVFTDTSVDAGGDIRARLFGPTGTAVNVDFGVDTGTADDTDADVAALADGGFVVSYTREVGAGDFDIRSAIFNADGSARGSVVLVDSSTALNTNSSSVAGLTGGNFVVAWEQQPTAGGDTEVFYRIHNSSGTPVTSATLIDTTGSINVDIQVAALKDGGFAVAYVDNGWALSGTEITLRIYNADGSLRADNLLPNTNTAGDQNKPSLTVLENGFIVVSWNDGNFTVYQAYTPSGARVGDNIGAFNESVESEIAALTGGLVAGVRSSTVTDASGDQSIRASVIELTRTITGDGTSEALTGDSLRDTIFGGGGNDLLDGGAGVDALFGGIGDDTYTVDNVSDSVSENPGEGSADTIVSRAPFFTLAANVETLVIDASAGNASGNGNADSNTIIGNAGNNVIYGFAGDDLILGGDGSDYLLGMVGNDVLYAGSGLWTDILEGGVGNDVYELHNGNSSVIENPGEGTDTVRSGAAFTALWANVENLVVLNVVRGDVNGNAEANIMTGNVGNDRFYGFAGNDTLLGGDGHDVLLGMQGNDSMEGGNGIDIFFAGDFATADTLVGGAGDDLYHLYSSGSTITEGAGEGSVDTILSYAPFMTLAANVEFLVLEASAGNAGANGNAGINTLIGNGGNNVLYGFAGDDLILGGDGSDYLLGMGGNDVMLAGSALWTDILEGGAGDDVYELYNANSTVIESSGEGTDTLRSGAGYTTLSANVENLVLLDAINSGANGNALGNTMTGNAGNNQLYGFGGNDSLAGGNGADFLLGMDGADTLVGGSGNDSHSGGAGSDTIDFNAVAEALDTVTDFTAGGGGDKLDIKDLLVGFNSGTSAVSDFVQLNESGGSTIVSVDANGPVGGASFTALVNLQGVTGLVLNDLVTNGNLVMS